jgi:hypothetical protein
MILDKAFKSRALIINSDKDYLKKGNKEIFSLINIIKLMMLNKMKLIIMEIMGPIILNYNGIRVS